MTQPGLDPNDLTLTFLPGVEDSPLGKAYQNNISIGGRTFSQQYNGRWITGNVFQFNTVEDKLAFILRWA